MAFDSVSLISHDTYPSCARIVNDFVESALLRLSGSSQTEVSTFQALDLLIDSQGAGAIRSDKRRDQLLAKDLEVASELEQTAVVVDQNVLVLDGPLAKR